MSSSLHFVIDTLWFTAKDLCTSSQSFNDQCWYRLKYHRIWQNGTLQKEHNTWWICWSSSSLHVVWGVAKLLYWDLRNTKLYNFCTLHSFIFINLSKHKQTETERNHRPGPVWVWRIPELWRGIAAAEASLSLADSSDSTSRLFEFLKMATSSSKYPSFSPRPRCRFGNGYGSSSWTHHDMNNSPI